jgi:hypothetical protein
VAFARNALDHALDPLPIIHNMVAVVRPGCYVVLRHAVNEAVTEDYEQLHQWTFDERDGRCIVWRRPGRHATSRLSWATAPKCAARVTISSATSGSAAPFASVRGAAGPLPQVAPASS